MKVIFLNSNDIIWVLFQCILLLEIEYHGTRIIIGCYERMTYFEIVLLLGLYICFLTSMIICCVNNFDPVLFKWRML